MTLASFDRPTSVNSFFAKELPVRFPEIGPGAAPGQSNDLHTALETEIRFAWCSSSDENDMSPQLAEVADYDLAGARRVDADEQLNCLACLLPPKGPADLQPIDAAESTDTGYQPIGMISPSTQRPQTAEHPNDQISWRPLFRQSLYYLAIMHSFRLATEPSTRNAMANPVVSGYFQTLGAMHGWSDGDGYYENYLGHPIEGAVSGYIWMHNDRRYRNVEFGRSRDYWMSRLRAYAFAWAFSAQFEIGLLSEASVGQIQRYCCAYGFVDHVITPNAGAIWMVGGDIIDKYVTRRIEDHTRNPVVRAVVRGVLNPPLSFANVLAGQVPWHRDNRPGVHDYNGELYLRVEHPSSAENRLVPSFELTASLPSALQLDGLSCIGGGGVGAFRLTNSWQWTAEVGGCTFGNFAKNWSGDSLTFSTGPQWISHTASRWSPHLSMRLGGQKITQEYIDPVVKQRVLESLPPGKSPKDVSYEYTTHFETTGLSLVVSGGADLRLNRALALRVANIDYVRSWLDPINGYDFNQGYRFSTGLVLRVGTW
jgi:hypothetical protein